MEIVQLRYLVAAAEHRSFRRAAATLNVTQPTLSKRIRELEEHLGTQLFERTSGGARLTATGEDYLVVAKRVLTDLDDMKNYAKLAKGGKAGQLRIGFYTALAGPLRDTVFAFAKQHPQVDLNIIEDNRVTLIPLLDRGSVDIVMVLGEPAFRSYAHLSLWSERIMVALPIAHPLADRDFVYWTDLKDERFVISLRDPGPEINDVLLSKLTIPGDRPSIKHVKAHHSLTISAVDCERGITLVCESSCVPPWPGVIFREVRDGNGPTRLGFVAYWRHDNGNPTLKNFLNQLQAYAPVSPPSSSVS